MKWNLKSWVILTLKSWVFHFIIIAILAYALSEIFHNVIFSLDTLRWMTSTIIQAFGAMIAIILSIGFYQKEKDIKVAIA
jgi:hypothetical protein